MSRVNIGFEVGTGDPVTVPLGHMVVCGQTSEADGHWVAGLSDGESSFVFYVRDRVDGRPQPRIDFSYKLTLRADDAATVDEARKILGVVGSVYTSTSARGPNGKPTYSLSVCRKAEVAHLITFFRRFPLRSKKQKDFEIWAEAFEVFTEAIAARTIKQGTGALRERAGRRTHRALEGRRLQRFYKHPPELIESLRVLANRLRDVRRYA